MTARMWMHSFWAAGVMALSPLISQGQEKVTFPLQSNCSSLPPKGPKTLFSWSDYKPENGNGEAKKNGNGQEEKKNGDHDGTIGNGNGAEPEEEDRITTDRPDATEASTTVGLGRIQLEMGYTYTFDKEGTVRLRGHSLPETLLRAGVFAEWLELRLGWNYGVERLTEEGINTRNSGSEDVYVGVKLALVEQKELLPEMALILQATLPTGVEAFSANRILPGFNLLYGWDINNFLSCAGSTAINAARDGLGHDYTEVFQSFTIGYSLADRLGAYTEWFAFLPHSAIDPGTTSQHYFNGGFTFLINNDFQLDVRAGVGLNRAADDFFLGSGFAIRF